MGKSSRSHRKEGKRRRGEKGREKLLGAREEGGGVKWRMQTAGRAASSQRGGEEEKNRKQRVGQAARSQRRGDEVKKKI